jgi:tRNA(Ile)-lysidine synthase
MKARKIDWLAAAQRLAEDFPRARLHPAVVNWAEADRSRKPWTVAFSGGADSLALLLLVCAHWPERRERLRVLHFNHRLRGRAATQDETFCRRVCAALRLKFAAGRWDAAHRHASEADARAARFEFLRSQLVAAKAQVLWLGHQQDDIAESILMRLARGSGLGGLAAPRPVQRVAGGRIHLRPLLTISKKEIVAALRKLGLPWQEDSTNNGAGYFRNRIRGKVIPAWQDATGDRDLLRGVALARELLEEDEIAVEQWLEELRPLAGRVLDVRRLAGKPRAIFRRALHRWLIENGQAARLSRPAFETLLNSVERGRPVRHSLGPDRFAVLRDGCLRCERVAVRPARRRRGRGK